MKKINVLTALLLITIPQFSLAIGYKVQIYNGSSEAINIIAGHAPVINRLAFEKCKWANTNYDLSNQNNWSKSTLEAWHSSVWSPRAIQSGKHRVLWCQDDRRKRWERRFKFYVDCDGDGEGNLKYTQTYPRNHLFASANYVFSLDGSHCLPN